MNLVSGMWARLRFVPFMDCMEEEQPQLVGFGRRPQMVVLLTKCFLPALPHVLNE
jgi:hypothetical protein